MFQVHKYVPQIGKIAIAAAVLGAASLSHAATGGLYNTGVDASGNVLADGATDSHYTVTLLDGPVSPSFAVSSTESYGAAWSTVDAGSKWITAQLGTGVTATTAGSVTGHDYFFTTSFDLTGYDFSTASISGKFMSDNGLSKILVNGVDSGQLFGLAADSKSFQGWSSFATLSGQFHAGVNTLSFEVLNADGPVGLRTELASNFAVAAVPEPESYAMLLAGLCLMGTIARRRNKKQA